MAAKLKKIPELKHKTWQTANKDAKKQVATYLKDKDDSEPPETRKRKAKAFKTLLSKFSRKLAPTMKKFEAEVKKFDARNPSNIKKIIDLSDQIGAISSRYNAELEAAKNNLPLGLDQGAKGSPYAKLKRAGVIKLQFKAFSNANGTLLHAAGNDLGN